MSWSYQPILLAAISAKAQSLTDNFSDNSLDSAKWTTSVVSSATVVETNQEIQITPANSTVNSEGQLLSVDFLDLTSSYAQVKATQVADTTNVYTNFQLYVNSTNYIGIGVGSGNLQFFQNVAGSFSVPYSVAYNSTDHKYWRLRESNGQTLADYSADGVTWVNFYAASNPIPLTGVQVQLIAKEHTSDATPGVAIFDDFNITTAGAAITSISDNFNDNSINSTLWNTYTANSGAIVEANQRIEITLAASTSGSWAGLYSKAQYDLTGNRIVVRIPAGTSGGNTWFDLTLSMEQLPIVDNFFSIGINYGTGNLEAIVTLGGVNYIPATLTYNSTDHAYLSLRESGGIIHWEYSATGLTGSWTELYSHAVYPEIPVTNLYVILDDYEFNGSSTPGTHYFDDLNITEVSASSTTAIYTVLEDTTPSTVALSTTLEEAGPYRSLQFSSASSQAAYVEDSSVLSLNGKNTITIAFWAYVSLNPYTDGVRFYNKENNFIMRLTNSTREVKADFYVGGAWVGEFGTAGAGFFAALDTWYHIMFTYDGSVATIYINNVSKATKSASGNFSTSGNRLFIGSTGANGAGGAPDNLFFDGNIFNFTIHDRVLNSTERGALYDSNTVPLNGLVTWYALREGTGSTSNDNSGNGNTLTFYNSPTWSTNIPFGQPTTALITTLEKSSTSTTAVQTSLEATVSSTSAILTILEKQAVVSTVALIANLEKPGASTTALSAAFEATTPSTVAVLTMLESSTLNSTTAMLTSLEIQNSSTIAVNAPLEANIRSTTAILTTLETAPIKSTTAIITTLEKAPVKSTTGILTTLETYATRNLGYGLRFVPGNTCYVTVTNNALLQGLTALTVEMSIIINASSGATFVRLFEYLTSPNGFEIQMQGTTVTCVVGNGTTTRSVATSALTVGTTYHIACVWDGSNVSLYLNGSFVTSGALSGGNTGNPAKNLIIGNFSTGSSTLVFPGMIDEVRISSSVRYTGAFTPATVPFAVDANTIALYHFDEGTGTTTTDSANSLNGTLGGTILPQWSTGALPLTNTTTAIFSTLEKVSQSTSGLLATLEAITASTVPLFANLENGLSSSTTAIETTLEISTVSSAAVLTTLEASGATSTTAILTTLSRSGDGTTAVLTTIEATKLSTTALLTTLEKSAVSSTVPLQTTLEAVTQSTTSVFAILERSGATSTAAVLSLLEKPRVSTTAVLATLEFPAAQSNVALCATLEKTGSGTVGITATLERASVSTVSTHTTLEVRHTSTTALLATLEQNTGSVVAINTTLEAPARYSTVALLVALEYGGSSTVGIRVDLQRELKYGRSVAKFLPRSTTMKRSSPTVVLPIGRQASRSKS